MLYIFSSNKTVVFL